LGVVVGSTVGVSIAETGSGLGVTSAVGGGVDVGKREIFFGAQAAKRREIPKIINLNILYIL
jgi:hypothetical protein